MSKKRRTGGSGFSWSPEQGGLLGLCLSTHVETEMSWLNNHLSLRRYTFLKVLMSHVNIN